LTITVGVGGPASASFSTPGSNGGDTQVLDNNNAVLAVAHGGMGGLPYPPSGGQCGVSSTSASGGASDPNAMISHSGAPAPPLSSTESGGMGYQVPGFAFQPIGVFGAGGAGIPIGPQAQDGQGGYALLSW